MFLLRRYNTPSHTYHPSPQPHCNTPPILHQANPVIINSYKSTTRYLSYNLPHPHSPTHSPTAPFPSPQTPNLNSTNKQNKKSKQPSNPCPQTKPIPPLPPASRLYSLAILTVQTYVCKYPNPKRVPEAGGRASQQTEPNGGDGCRSPAANR